MRGTEVLGVVALSGTDRDRRSTRIPAFVAHQHDLFSHLSAPLRSIECPLRAHGRQGWSPRGRTYPTSALGGAPRTGWFLPANNLERTDERAELDPAVADGCARCDEPATTVVIGVSAVTAYLDLCEDHLASLLQGARPVESRMKFELDEGPTLAGRWRGLERPMS